MVRELEQNRSALENAGARVIWFITNVPESDSASYLERVNIDFGWSADDSENSAEAKAVLGSCLIFGAPWVGVIRASDMTLYAYDSVWTGNIDIVDVAQELAR